MYDKQNKRKKCLSNKFEIKRAFVPILFSLMLKNIKRNAKINISKLLFNNKKIGKQLKVKVNELKTVAAEKNLVINKNKSKYIK